MSNGAERDLEQGAEALGALLRDAARADGEVAPDFLGSARRRSGGMRPGLAFGLAAAVLLAVALPLLRQFWPAAGQTNITYELAGAARKEDGYFVAGAHPSTLHFSDGSSVVLEPDTRMRVRSTSVTGATLVLEEGEIALHVVHRPDTGWNVLAGALRIHVVGTRFRVRLDAEGLVTEVSEGAVRVDGQSATAQTVVTAGHRLRAKHLNPGFTLESVAPTLQEPAAPEAPRTPAASPEAATSTRARPPSPTAKSAPTPVPARSWKVDMAAGKFAKIVAEAEELGIERCHQECSAAELRYLADAARYTGKLNLAERTLAALQKRSPAEAPRAAYLMGTMAESRGQSGEALRWYEKSLGNAAGGAYADEAEAGRLRMLVAGGQHAAARGRAREYLQRHPNGVGAALARRLLEAP